MRLKDRVFLKYLSTPKTAHTLCSASVQVERVGDEDLEAIGFAARNFKPESICLDGLLLSVERARHISDDEKSKFAGPKCDGRTIAI